MVCGRACYRDLPLVTTASRWIVEKQRPTNIYQGINTMSHSRSALHEIRRVIPSAFSLAAELLENSKSIRRMHHVQDVRNQSPRSICRDSPSPRLESFTLPNTEYQTSPWLAGANDASSARRIRTVPQRRNM